MLKVCHCHSSIDKNKVNEKISCFCSKLDLVLNLLCEVIVPKTCQNNFIIRVSFVGLSVDWWQTPDDFKQGVYFLGWVQKPSD